MKNELLPLIKHNLFSNPIRSFWLLVLAAESSFFLFIIIKPSGPYSNLDLVGLAPMIVGPLTSVFSCWFMQRNRELLENYLGSNPKRMAKANISGSISIALTFLTSHLLVFSLTWVYLEFIYEIKFEWVWFLTFFGAIGVCFSFLGLGILVGNYFRNPLAPTLLGIFGLAIPFIFALIGLNKTLLITGGSSIDSDFVTFHPKMQIVELQFLAGFSLFMFAILLSLKNRFLKRIVMALALLTFAASLWNLQSAVDARFELKITKVETECKGGAVRVCLPVGVHDSEYLIESAVKNLNSELERVGVENPISRLKVFSLGKILSDSDIVIQSKNTIPITYRWLPASTEFVPSKFDDYLRNQLEYIIYPPKCFGYGGIYAEAGKGGNRKFEGYVIYLLMDLSRDVEWLKWMNSKSQEEIDNWIIQSWSAVQSCSAVPKI